MQDDRAVLEQRNINIGWAESEGKRDWLDKILATEFAFRRANGEIVGRADYLCAVGRTDRRETQVESISFYGERAIVTCIVTVKSKDGDRKFHNLRLFVRDQGEWKLLGWANEPERAPVAGSCS